MDDSDASALVKAALQNDDEAARALVRQLYPLVVKIVRAHRSRRTPEEDLCQMIFIKVFQKLSQFSGNVPLEHWARASRSTLVSTKSNRKKCDQKCDMLLECGRASGDRKSGQLERRTGAGPAVRFAPTGGASPGCAEVGPSGWRSICYTCRDEASKKYARSLAGARRSLKCEHFEPGRK